ncbi:MAG: hypothetical protein U5K00_14290 [Melioribacteraceae bacterium]|nr:hypothetical protein [Melioribacteraceae bacterium]
MHKTINLGDEDITAYDATKFDCCPLGSVVRNFTLTRQNQNWFVA